MKEPKLLRQLKELSPVELDRFRDFVHSPFFNRNTSTTQLFEHIYSQLPAMSHFDKKKIFQEIYGAKPFKVYKVNNLMSYLMGLLERFHGQILLEEKQREQQLLELEYSYRKNQTALFQSQQLKLKKQLLSSKNKDSQHYYHLHRYYLLNDYFSLQQGSRVQAELLRKQVAAFDTYYISEKLKYSCDMLSRMNVMNREFALDFLPELLAYLRSNWDKYRDIAPIEMYYNVLMTLLESDQEAHYKKLKVLLVQHQDRFGKEEAQLLYDYAQNYCIKKINQGKSSYLKEIFTLYQQLIETGLILKNDLLSEWDYKNIVTVGCRLGAFEWTEHFIKTFKEHLNATSRENAYTYNLASFYYSTNQYNEALLLLQQLEFTDVYYHLGAKFIQCKIYYELEETEALLSLLDSFRIYVLRNKNMAKKQQQAPLNFIRFTKKLTLLRNKQDLITKQKFQQQLEKLTGAIRDTEAIVNVDWLMERLKAMKRA